MYYYILESPTSRNARNVYNHLRDDLTYLGITGEITVANPARPAHELVKIAIARGYTTIVVVGGDKIINDVATLVLDRVVLGVVPVDASPEVTELFGVTQPKEALEAVKNRRISECNLTLIEPNNLIFLDVEVTSPNLVKAQFVIENKVKGQAYFNRITVSRDLEIRIHSIHKVAQPKIFGLFSGGSKDVASDSLFTPKNARLITEPSLPITCCGAQVSQTPASFRLLPDALKIITKRGTIS